MTRQGTRGIVAALLTAALVATSSAGAKPKVAATERVDVGPGGTQANGEGDVYSISAKGRYVAFTSYASNLLPGDSGPGGDVFVRDRKEGTTELVSPGIDGQWPNGDSFEPSLSANGRYVAFTSSASNLVPVDTGHKFNLFVYDRKRQTTELITANSAGEPIGLYPFHCAISGNGRYVAFADEGSNLVPGDTNHQADVFVHDRKTGTTERVSVSSSGAEGDGFAVDPEITHNGRFVTFFSSSTNLVPDDTNGADDVFVHDRKTGETELVSVNSAGEQGNGLSYLPSISADGRFVAFGSVATNLPGGDIGVRVFVHDRKTGETELASANSAGQPFHGDYPSISDDGRFVAFHDATVGQVFVHDRAAGTTVPASVGLGGELANRLSLWPVISGDGRWVAFDSLATNLVPDDTNDEFDSFVRGPLR
jgi:Tol biopolymer transport system component